MITGRVEWAMAYTSLWSRLRWNDVIRRIELEQAREEMRVYGYNPPF